MIKHSLILLLFTTLLFADESEIKNDNTMIVTIDDFAITNQAPLKTNNGKELTVIIRNRSKSQYLFNLKKNSQHFSYISIPAQEDYTKTLSLEQNDTFLLRPLSPPSEDIILSGVKPNI